MVLQYDIGVYVIVKNMGFRMEKGTNGFRVSYSPL